MSAGLDEIVGKLKRTFAERDGIWMSDQQLQDIRRACEEAVKIAGVEWLADKILEFNSLRREPDGDAGFSMNDKLHEIVEATVTTLHESGYLYLGIASNQKPVQSVEDLIRRACEEAVELNAEWLRRQVGTLGFKLFESAMTIESLRRQLEEAHLSTTIKR